MNDKTIWITGASTGIGRALAIKFAKNGWNVAASARRENLLKELEELNQDIYSFPLDVTDKEKCKEVFKKIEDKFKTIDISFFSTGTWDPGKEKEIDVEQIENVMKVNFFGTLNSIKNTTGIKKVDIYLSSLLLQVIEGYQILQGMDHQSQL